MKKLPHKTYSVRIVLVLSAGTQMPTMRKVVKMGMAFDRETMTVGEYLVEM